MRAQLILCYRWVYGMFQLEPVGSCTKSRMISGGGCYTFLGKLFLLVDFLYINASRRIPGQNITLKVGITDVYVQYYLNTYHNVSLRYFLRALTWYHEGNKLTPVASFPGLPRLQFLIACSMQKRREKAW